MEQTQVNPAEHRSMLAEVNREPEVAAFLRMPVETFRYWRLRGEGPRYFRIGRSIRYRRDDVLAWIEARTVSGPEAS